MTERKTGHAELPLFYRLVLKFPKLSVEGLHPAIQGFFWVIGIPIFLIGYVFFNLGLMVYLSFPYNYAVAGTAGFLLFMFISRILVERAINSANAAINDKQVWREVKEAVEDYLSVCRNLKDKRETEA
jgi:hypothetical protein